MEYVLFVILGVASSFLSAIFGFGTALIILAIGPHILPVKETIVLGTIMFAASTVGKSWLFFRYIDWKVAGIVAIGSLPFAYLGAALLSEAPTSLIRQLLGVMILIYVGLTSLNVLSGIGAGGFVVGTRTLVFGSAVYGFISGLLGSGNLVKVILFRELKFDKEAFVGIMATTAVLSNFVKLSAYYQTGLLSPQLIVPSFFLVTGSLFVAFLGKRYLGKISAEQFELGIKVILVVSALGLFF